MEEAIALSSEAMRQGRGGPFGAVVVRDGTVVGRGRNEVTSAGDPTAHAEIQAIRDACRRIGSFQLAGCELYASCEPCPMCLAAIHWARIGRLYYAATRDDAAEAGFDDARFYEQLALPAEERQLPSEQGMREEARVALAEWLRKADRTPY